MKNGEFVNNYYAYCGMVSIEDTLFLNNSGGLGSIIHSESSQNVLNGIEFIHNTGDDYGVIFDEKTDISHELGSGLCIENSVFFNNRARIGS